MLKDLKVGDEVRQAAILRLQKIGNSSNGGVFARGNLEDNSGKVQFIAFDRSTVETLRNATEVVPMIVSGRVETNKYNMAVQIVVNKVDDVRPEDDLTNLLPTGDFDIEVYKGKLENLIKSIRTPSLKHLLEKIFSGRFLEEFCKNPAGSKMHHAYVGGLLQHSVDVAELACAMGHSIGNVDMDLLISGGLLHDIGKVKEIDSGIGFTYTSEGRLLGHIAMSVMIVREAALEMKIPTDSILALEHILLSHHGEKEKGSPVECSMKEAFIVHYADDLNATMNQFETTEEGWEYNQMLRRFILRRN